MKINEKQVTRIVRNILKEMWDIKPTDIPGAAAELHELATQLETIPNLGEDERVNALKSIIGQLQTLVSVLNDEII